MGQNEPVRCASIIGLWLLTIEGWAAPQADKPNLILLTADCITFDRLGAYGAKIVPLPEIDRLANGGARFDNFYVSPGESVTMVTLLTGRYPFRHGWMWHNEVEKWGAPSLSAEREVLVARVLRSHGYQCGFIGDWLLNDVEKEPLVRHGFDSAETVASFARANVACPFFLYARLGGAKAKEVNNTVGQIVKLLAELKIDGQTIVMITRERLDDGAHSLREASIRVPLLVYGTYRVRRKQEVRNLVDFSDVFSTLIELAGARLPRGRVIDGRSFVPQLRGETGRPREWVFSQYGTDRILANWQYKIYSNARFYNLLSDPNEEHNLARANVSEVVAERERLQKLLNDLPADKPLNFPYARRLRVRKR